MCRLVLLCAVSPDPRPLIQEDLSLATPFIQEIKSATSAQVFQGYEAG